MPQPATHLSLAPAAAAEPPAQPTMCLLHGDYHVMDQRCWDTTVDWYFTHPDFEGADGRDAYLAEVERQMLDNLIKDLR
jgi:hypothetical protein